MYPSLSLAICRLAPVMRLCRGSLLLQASGLLVACGSTFGLLLGLACAPGRSKRLIIMTGGTSLRYCQKAETLETVSNSGTATLYLAHLSGRPFSFLPSCFHFASTPLQSRSTTSLERLLLV